MAKLTLVIGNKNYSSWSLRPWLAMTMFAPVVLRFITYDVKLDEDLRAYSEAILALPAMQEWMKAAEIETETISNFEL